MTKEQELRKEIKEARDNIELLTKIAIKNGEVNYNLGRQEATKEELNFLKKLLEFPSPFSVEEKIYKRIQKLQEMK